MGSGVLTMLSFVTGGEACIWPYCIPAKSTFFICIPAKSTFCICIPAKPTFCICIPEGEMPLFLPPFNKLKLLPPFKLQQGIGYYKPALYSGKTHFNFCVCIPA